MTAAVRIRPPLPTRQAAWTRQGAESRFTDTEPKRAAIRTAVAGMAWLEPDQLSGVLGTARVRYALTGLTLAPSDVIRFAAVIDLPDPNSTGQGWGEPRLIGLQTARADRHLLLDDGRQVVGIWHDTAVSAGWAR